MFKLRARKKGDRTLEERETEERKKIVQKGETVGTLVIRVFLLP